MDLDKPVRRLILVATTMLCVCCIGRGATLVSMAIVTLDDEISA